MGSSIEITPELLAGFLDEAPEYLEMLDAGLMEFESQMESGVLSLNTPEDEDRMNTMFRAAHSLKGLAAAFGFDRIKELTHRMETLFDQLRMKQRTLDSDGIETLFVVFDRLKALVQELADDSSGPVELDDVLAALDRILEQKGTAGEPEDGQAADDASGSAAGDDSANPASPSATETDDDQATPPRETESSVTEGTEGDTGSVIQSEIFDDPDLATLFIETTTEAIEEINEGLLKLEEHPDDPDVLNKVFRCAHNIKGASGAAGLTGMNRLTHNLETVFDRLRCGALALDDDLMNVVFRAVDQLRSVIDRIRGGTIEDCRPDEIIGQLERWTTSPSAPATSCEASENKETAEASHAGDERPSHEGEPPEAPASVGYGGGDGVLRITFEFPDGFDEAPIQAFIIHNKLADVGTVLSSDPDLDAIEADCALKRVVIELRTDSEPDEIRHLLEAFKVEHLSVTHAGEEESKPVSPDVDEQQQTMTSAPARAAEPSLKDEKAKAKSTPPSSPSPAASSEKTEQKPTPTPSPHADPKGPSPAGTAAKSKPAGGAKGKQAAGGKAGAHPVKTTETLRVDQERLDHLMNLGGELVINRARFVQIHGRFREVFDGKNLGYVVDDIRERLDQLAGRIERISHEVPHEQADALNRELKHLGDRFRPICSLVERVHDLRTSMIDFEEALHALTRVSEGIQKGIMGTRMVPIGPLFNRFRRVVRDLSKSTGKQVRLEVRGEHTELDKRMIDELGDPLTHMVRNSVDHGIEPPDVRQAAGKDPVGTLTLEACHRGNSICIEVRDDGAGINLEKIREKVLERELATPAQLEAMSDRELMQYIFKPGFSTATKVTEVSGRGMGMDIVVNKIEKLSGTIEVDSTPGEGSTITIKLPLTLAILTSMVARIGEGVYAIPLECVGEIITVRRRDILSVQRREVVRIRERVIPVNWFEDIFQTDLPTLQTASRNRDELTLMIIEMENDRIGLVVDELLGQEDVVIKSIAENYRNVRGIAGASIRGDGSVSLILDIGAMMEMASKAAAKAASDPVPVPVGAEG